VNETKKDGTQVVYISKQADKEQPMEVLLQDWFPSTTKEHSIIHVVIVRRVEEEVKTESQPEQETKDEAKGKGKTAVQERKELDFKQELSVRKSAKKRSFSVAMAEPKVKHEPSSTPEPFFPLEDLPSPSTLFVQEDLEVSGAQVESEPEDNEEKEIKLELEGGFIAHRTRKRRALNKEDIDRSAERS
jgi:hypothetical protein